MRASERGHGYRFGALKGTGCEMRSEIVDRAASIDICRLDG